MRSVYQTPAIDIWSAGITMLTLMAGIHPVLPVQWRRHERIANALALNAGGGGGGRDAGGVGGAAALAARYKAAKVGHRDNHSREDLYALAQIEALLGRGSLEITARALGNLRVMESPEAAPLGPFPAAVVQAINERSVPVSTSLKGDPKGKNVVTTSQEQSNGNHQREGANGGAKIALLQSEILDCDLDDSWTSRTMRVSLSFKLEPAPMLIYVW